MIKPHGSDALAPRFVYDTERHHALTKEAESLPSLLVNSAAAANAVMLGAGYFNPLQGYMNKADALSVAATLHTTAGLFWPVPVLNLTADAAAIRGAKRIALRDPNVEGNPVLAIQTVEAIEEFSEAEISAMAQKIFRTLDPKHPGVATFTSLGRVAISGPIEVLNFSYFQQDFPDTFRTAVEIRNEMAERGWNTVVAFQTRNPMHRAHEELCKMARDAVKADGVLIHMLLGKLKAGDIPAHVRDAAIRKMVELYFPANTVMITGYGFDMLYAGPREAVLHAVFRQNCGCTHLIVGRDHAGVGSYYGAFDAQTVFDEEVPAGALEIQIFRADNTAYSKKLNRVVMMRDAPDHTDEDFVQLSGTKVREMLAAGKDLPVEFARPEVARILMGYYQSEAN
jgi:sulfate adenylyltransferase